MKKLNQNNNMSNTKLLERGGLMIEALAMLGLIAVVTPTMYKKSAERTLEVEDINTATTVRTYMNAVEAYMANEYGTFVSEPDAGVVLADHHHDIKKGHFYEDPTDAGAFGSRDGPAFAYYVDNGELANYLPYGFDVDRAMYDYNAPETRIVKNGNNLTAFVRFPAKNGQADGIGQERTARIASLVGATGGYMPDNTSARGVGGIWSLNSGNLDNLFGNDAAGGGNANTYSLVTASANVAMDVNGGQMDNDKYLQRTREDDTEPGSGDEMWRNTMRTDLYLGGHVGNETQTIPADEDTRRHSIRNIQSLIVGADQANSVPNLNPDGTPVLDADGNPTSSENRKYGLYITGDDGDDYANAFIGGTLMAAEEQFVATAGGGFNGSNWGDGAQLLFGRVGASDDFNTEIQASGDIYNAGANGILFGNFSNGGASILIGNNGVGTLTGGTGLRMYGDEAGEVFDYYLGEHFAVLNDSKETLDSNSEANSILMFTDETGSPTGYHQIPATNSSGYEDAPTLDYNDEPTFPVKIGANTRVDGLLAAGQVDAWKTRTATLKAGSTNIDDAEHWLNVDEYGVMIETPSTQPGKTILALADNEDGSTDGIYLEIEDASARKSDNIETGFYVDSDGFYYRATNNTTNQENMLRMDVDELENINKSTFKLNSGDIKMTAGNGSVSSGAKEKGTISLEAKDGTKADGKVDPGTIELKTNRTKIQMGQAKEGQEILISNSNGDTTTHNYDDTSRDYRVHMLGGWLDLENTGFHVTKTTTGNRAAPIFSVSAMDKQWQDFSDRLIADNWTDDDGDNLGDDLHNPYAVGVHGPAIFTNYIDAGASSGSWSSITPDKYVSYMSVGQYYKEAGVNVVAAPSAASGNGNVLTIDMSGTPSTSSAMATGLSAVVGDDPYVIDPHITHSRRASGIGSGIGHGVDAEFARVPYTTKTVDGKTYYVQSTNEDALVEEGQIYMRRGMLEVVPPVEVGSSSTNSASQGVGIIKASRFVANNVDSSGAPIDVPQLVNSEFVKDNYEGSSYKRYDTYMVNPAYTSVMHDIKLTTRGGARLSDILPDFINKGIYIASNTVKENANNRKMEFELTASGVTGFDSSTAASAYDYVSPYMGIVPAPQCPPGYGRVITLNPVSFEMAQVGTPRLQKLADDKYTYYAATEDVLPDAMSNGSTGKLLTDVDIVDDKVVPKKSHVAHQTNQLDLRTLDVKTEVLAEGAPKAASGETADGVNDRVWNADVDLKINGTKIRMEDDSAAEEFKFKMTNLENFASQLKVTTPTEMAKPEAIDTKPYVIGYATNDKNNVFRPVTFQQSTFLKSAAVPLVMGQTKKFGDTAGAGEYTSGWAVLMGFIYPYDHYKTVIDHLGVDQFSSFATGFYWNIFPVLRDRLEAYATIYCYFDRDNLYKQNTENDTSGGIKHIDPYNYLESLPTSFRKQSHGDYIERLNDPTMKYYDEW